MDVAGFLDGFVQDQVKRRCLTEEDFGQPIANENNDVPLYDQYNTGLTAYEEGMDRNPLNLEGNRVGLTGYIPSMEQGMMMGAAPRPKALVMELEEPDEEMKEESRKRRGLSR
jgi:hypothetical protein